jgi:5-methylthioadenosine/S-adenosylhomocysteine deaminase
LISTLVHSGTLVCMDAAYTVVRGDLLIEDGVITALGDAVPGRLERLAKSPPIERIDASGCLVLPGFVHAHLHLCQTLFRGMAEQADLLRWLRESIWPLEAAHTEASIVASARLGLAELIAGGVTCVNDMGTVRHTEVIGEVLAESGMRALFGRALMDQGEGVPRALLDSPREALAGALAVADRFHGAANGRLQVSLAPRFILSCSEALWRDVRDASREKNLVVHTHLGESPGESREVEAAVHRTATRALAVHEVLSERLVAAHGVWLDPQELALLADADSALVHCPGSNLKLGSGFARVRAWLEAGLRCGIGSDGAACNNRLDTFHELSLAAGISRALQPDAALTAREVLTLATQGGAEALGLGDQIGSLEVGKQADLAVVDVGGPHLTPLPEDPYTTLVHAARPTDVRLTMVAGRVLYRDGAWTTLDAARARADAAAEARGLARRAANAGAR